MHGAGRHAIHGAVLGVGVSVCGGICILVAAAWLQEGTDKLPSAAYFVLLQAGDAQEGRVCASCATSGLACRMPLGGSPQGAAVCQCRQGRGDVRVPCAWGCGSSLLYRSMLCNGPAEAALAAPASGSNTGATQVPVTRSPAAGGISPAWGAPMQLELHSRVVTCFRYAVHGVSHRLVVRPKGMCNTSAFRSAWPQPACSRPGLNHMHVSVGGSRHAKSC